MEKNKVDGDTTKDITQQIEKMRRQQTEVCLRELDAAIRPILRKYNCQLDISIVLRQGQIIPRLGVKAI